MKLYLLNRGLYSPLEAFYTLLIFILCKEFNVTPLQLTVMVCAKPVVSLFAFQTSVWLVGKGHRFQAFLIALTLCSALPCFLFPFVSNSWFYIASYALFMTSLRASNPLWIEILKQTYRPHMSQLVAKGSALNYALVILLPLLLAPWMDLYPGFWKICFVFLGFLLLLNVFVLCRVKWDPEKVSPQKVMANSGEARQRDRAVFDEGIAARLLPRRKALEVGSRSPHELPELFEGLPEKHLIAVKHSWREDWQIIKSQTDFIHYQLLFFLGGAGLVALQPVLPVYFTETLHLSYTQLTLAFSLCKGVAFVLSSPLWVHSFNRHSLYALNGAVNLLSTLFIACLISSTVHSNWLFIAYLLYGAMQAGCEMSWNLSPPTYAKGKESTSYSAVNLAFVGLRGLICPFLGQWLYFYTNALAVLTFGGCLCLLSVFYAGWLTMSSRRQAIRASP